MKTGLTISELLDAHYKISEITDNWIKKFPNYYIDIDIRLGNKDNNSIIVECRKK